jgi:hypothetical protein
MTVNITLLRRTLSQIETHPELWDQADWRNETSCGTSHCFAGWAAVLNGAAFVRRPDGSVSNTEVIPPGGGDAEPVWDYAARALGIEHTIGGDCDMPPLFHSWNTLADLYDLVGELITGGAR